MQRPLPTLLRILPLGLILVLLVTGLVLGWHRYLTLDYLADIRLTLKAFAADHGWLAVLAYVLAYALAVSLAFPATWLLTLAGGFLYGILAGGLLAATGATMGAAVLFWAAQTAFGEGLRARADGFAGKVAKGVEDNAFSYLLALRLAPVLPFAVINVLPALFRVPLLTYVAATLLGILPGAIVYASIGQGLESAFAEAAALDRAVAIGDLVTPGITLGLFGLALLATIAPITGFMRRKWAGRNA